MQSGPPTTHDGSFSAQPASPPSSLYGTGTPPEQFSETRPRRWPLILAVLIVVLIVIIATLFLVLSTKSSPPIVTITALGFEWDSPPTTLCETFSFGSPSVPFDVNASASFNVSWHMTCEPNASVPSGKVYVINSVSTVFGIPFSIVSSNVPVTVGYTSYSWFNVTLTAPATAWSGQLYVFITASED
jgi:hypothetical protein